jgi:hypothetical protein
MNRFLTISIASALALGSIAGVAAAASRGEHGGRFDRHDEDNQDTVAATQGWGYATTISGDEAHDLQLIRHWRGNRFDVENIADANDSEADVVTGRAAERGYLASLHRAIERNPRLESRLLAQNVELRNVIGIAPAGNGSMTVYVQ